MHAEAAKLGYQLVYTDAASSAAKQVADVNSMIAQGVDLIFLAPREEKPLIPAVMAAKRAGIPVILLDRNVDQNVAKAGRDYVTFIGSDFVDEGKRAAEALTKAVNGNAKIIQLEGTTGSSPANDRRKGFEDYIKAHPGMKVVASQSGDFVRDKGRQVAETLIQAHPDATAIYAHNDEMAIGAIAASRPRARRRQGRRSSYRSTARATRCRRSSTARCSRRSSAIPSSAKAFETMARYAKGEKIEPWVINNDRFFDKTNAAQLINDAY